MKALSPIAILFLGLAASCAALQAPPAHEAPIAVLDGTGITSPAMSIDAGEMITFLNGDAQPHQIYSPECPELDSTLLRPGETFRSTTIFRFSRF